MIIREEIMNNFIVVYIVTLTLAGVGTLAYVSLSDFNSQSKSQTDTTVWCKNMTVVHPKCQVFVKEGSGTNKNRLEILPIKEYLLGETCLENNIFYINESADSIELQCSAPYPIKVDYFDVPEGDVPNSEYENLIETEEDERHLKLSLDTKSNWTGKYIVRSLENKDVSSVVVLTFGGDVLEKHERVKRYCSSSSGYYYSHFYSELQPLVELIARRLLLADKVAINKFDEKKAVEDLPREKIILENTVRQAQAVDLSSRWAEKFFRDQIEANKDIQNALIKMWEKNGKRPEGPPVDLSSQIRPQIDLINHEMLKIAKATIRVRGAYQCISEVDKDARYITFLYSLDDLHEQALRKAITNVCK